MKVVNSYGVKIDYDVAVMMMDDELRESLHDKLSPCSEQKFFEEYAEAHEKQFNEEWELDKPNPCY
ncbi:MAG: hypothetical protein DBY32_04030 [Phascolarctobacterium sp.]|nr:MAG: hypothetical protein DBY32_04030 [Phascolarctobacterium sp.]